MKMLAKRKSLDFLLMAIAVLATVNVATAKAVAGGGKCPMVRIEAERLPDLNVPRFGHRTLFVNGETVVVGGHTTGFVPTRTVEYFADGRWHQLATAYDHDHATAVPMRSGKVLLAGGHEKHLGIGQIFAAELYDPTAHTVGDFGCLDMKRCMAEGLEMDSGRVVIAGNWWLPDDAIEVFNAADGSFTRVKDLATARSFPYMLRTARDNAMVFSSVDSYGQPFDTIFADRLRGNAFVIPLFAKWRPFYNQVQNHSQAAFIGDETKDIYSYLLPVIDGSDQLAIAITHGEQVQLLPTDCPVPMEGPFGPLGYYSYVTVDRDRQRAYVMASQRKENDHRFYVLAIDYAATPARLTLYYTDPMEGMGWTQPVLNDEGDLVMAGGSDMTLSNGNFVPFASAFVLRVARGGATPASSVPAWLWVVAGLLVAAVGGLVVWRRSCRKPSDNSSYTEEGYRPLTPDNSPLTPANSSLIPDNSPQPEESSAELMARICRLMDEKKPYLSHELKVSDVAAALGTNVRYVADCIRNCEKCSFSQFVNRYRIEYVKKLLIQKHNSPEPVLESPSGKVAAAYLEAGFANERTFFRTFKLFTGMTPREWLAGNAKKQQVENNNR